MRRGYSHEGKILLGLVQLLRTQARDALHLPEGAF